MNVVFINFRLFILIHTRSVSTTYYNEMLYISLSSNHVETDKIGLDFNAEAF